MVILRARDNAGPLKYPCTDLKCASHTERGILNPPSSYMSSTVDPLSANLRLFIFHQSDTMTFAFYYTILDHILVE